MLDGVVEGDAVGRRVVEARQFLPPVSSEVSQTGVLRDLAALAEHLEIELVELVPLSQIGRHDQPPCLLALGAVLTLPVQAGLWDRLGRAVPVDAQSAHELLELVPQLHQLAEDRHVFRAVDVRLGAEAAEQLDCVGPGRVARRLQRQQPVAQRLFGYARLRYDLLDEEHELAIGLLIGRIFGHLAVDLRLRLEEHRSEIAPLLQPGLGGGRGQFGSKQSVDVRLDGAPVKRVNLWKRHE